MRPSASAPRIIFTPFGVRLTFYLRPAVSAIYINIISAPFGVCHVFYICALMRPAIGSFRSLPVPVSTPPPLYICQPAWQVFPLISPSLVASLACIVSIFSVFPVCYLLGPCALPWFPGSWCWMFSSALVCCPRVPGGGVNGASPPPLFGALVALFLPPPPRSRQAPATLRANDDNDSEYKCYDDYDY